MKLKFTVVFVCVLLIQPILVTGQADMTIIATNFDTDILITDDGVVDPSWDLVEYSISPIEFGDTSVIKMGVNSSHLFTLIQFDSSKDWIALEFGAYDEFCMVDGNDGWTFYTEDNSVVGYDELYSGSLGPPDHDTSNDLIFEVIEDGDEYFLEIVRLLDTGDNSDLQMQDGDLWNIKFASSTHHARGGIDNPTEFGPSDIYYLSIQMGDEIEVPVVPKRIDYDFYKLISFIGIFVSAGIFMLAHIMVRQVIWPLSHPKAVVDNSFKRPTIKSRWEETFGDKSQKSHSMDESKEAKA